MSNLTLTPRGRKLFAAARIAGTVLAALTVAAMFILLLADAAMYQ